MALTSSDFTTNNSNWWSVTRTWNSVEISYTGAWMIWAKCNDTQNSNIIYAQCNLTWNPTGEQEQFWGMIISSTDFNVNTVSYNQPYNISINSRAQSSTWRYALSLWTNTPLVYYNTTTWIDKWKDVKITYNTSNNEIKYWYWDTWTSAWVQMWTTQTYDILQGWDIKLYLYNNYLNSLWSETYTMNNIYFWNAVTDYTTQYPAEAPINSSAFFSFLT